MWVDELSVVMDLSGEVGIVLLGGLENDLEEEDIRNGPQESRVRRTCLGAIGKLMGGQVHLAK